MAGTGDDDRTVWRRVLQTIEVFEQAVYAGIALFLVIAAIGLFVSAARLTLLLFDVQAITGTVITMLDQLLLVFMATELIHTVRITLRDRSLTAEPFLIVGVIAGVRRILILTAKAETMVPGPGFEVFWVELVLLIVLVLAMVVALLLWRRAYPAGSPRL